MSPHDCVCPPQGNNGNGNPRSSGAVGTLEPTEFMGSEIRYFGTNGAQKFRIDMDPIAGVDKLEVEMEGYTGRPTLDYKTNPFTRYEGVWQQGDNDEKLRDYMLTKVGQPIRIALYLPK